MLLSRNGPSVIVFSTAEQSLTFSLISPFHGLGSPAFEDSLSPELELVDGGTNGEVIPLNPLFVKARGIDTIIAVDGSADTDENWPECVPFILSH